MTGRFLEKLKSQQGGSFILALLFFLVCSMIASSILMASVSNTGKINSNKYEHEKYLILSSAINLICDDINNASYAGSYTYIEDMTDGDTQTIVKKLVQNKGNYSGEIGAIVLADFDSIFAREIAEKLPSDVSGEGLKDRVIDSHTLKIRSDTGKSMDEEVVEMTLKVVEESYAIELTAELDDYKITAEITPTSTKPTIPKTMTVGMHSTSEMTWEVGWITVVE